MPRATLGRMTHPAPAASPIASQPLTRALEWVHARRGVAWALLAVYAVAVSLPHENVQWAVNELAIRIRHANVYRLFATVVTAIGGLLTWRLLHANPQPQLPAARRLWFLALLLIAGAWAALTANNVELVHYPQYFPEGVALAALTLSPPEAVAWVAILGGLDESYQYWVLSHGRVTLLDFNDIYMDVLGGIAGIAFAMAFLRGSPAADGRWLARTVRRPGVLALAGITAAGIALRAAGRMLLVEDKGNPTYWFALGRFQAPSFWAHIVENGPKHYHTLTPLEGMALIGVTVFAVAALCRRFVMEIPQRRTAK